MILRSVMLPDAAQNYISLAGNAALKCVRLQTSVLRTCRLMMAPVQAQRL